MISSQLSLSPPEAAANKSNKQPSVCDREEGSRHQHSRRRRAGRPHQRHPGTPKTSRRSGEGLLGSQVRRTTSPGLGASPPAANNQVRADLQTEDLLLRDTSLDP